MEALRVPGGGNDAAEGFGGGQFTEQEFSQYNLHLSVLNTFKWLIVADQGEYFGSGMLVLQRTATVVEKPYAEGDEHRYELGRRPT